MRKIGFGIFLIVTMFSCVHVNSVLMDQQNTKQPISPRMVKIYRTADQVPGKYEEIALINANGNSRWTDESELIYKMRNEAARLGANGIILDAISEPSDGAKVVGAFLGVPTSRRGKAVAIFVHWPL